MSTAATGATQQTRTAAGRPRGPDQREPAIYIEALSYAFGEGETRKPVLVNNNLKVMPGEIVIMTGPSGSGKTTLLTLIGGLRTAQTGVLRVLGFELHKMRPGELIKVRREIGFIFQAHNLFESLTALQNVMLALELKEPNPQRRRQRALEILKAVDMHVPDDPRQDRVNYKPEKLSGGQRQRVAIARALANHPRLVLADEPTAALDEQRGQQVMTLLSQRAKNDGVTSLIVTHDNRILKFADRIVNMVDGRIRSNVLVAEAVQRAEFLSRIPIFARVLPEQQQPSVLAPSTLTEVAEKLMEESFPAGTVICRKGDVGDKFYLIRNGSVKVVDLPDGEKILKEGDFFGEKALLTDEGLRTATVVANEDVDTYSLGKADFHAALASSPSFKEDLYKVYFQRQ
jgi:putative ABC transport system ATP-binding protein